MGATLIDNVFVSKDLHNAFDSGILMTDLSDHFPSLVLIKQNKLTDKEPLESARRNLTEKKIDLVKEELYSIDWNEVLNAESVSENCENFSNILEASLNKIAPIQMHRISGK